MGAACMLGWMVPGDAVGCDMGVYDEILVVCVCVCVHVRACLHAFVCVCVARLNKKTTNSYSPSKVVKEWHNIPF